MRASVYFDHCNAGLTGFFEVGNVGGGEDAGKVGGDRVNGGNQAIASS
ncbi:MAG: hypothetical protein LH647_23510 [Leptolyngbyaceae cyanobacterium CAN_BIN12]|nr:hypothetical protein [Leptolyngbyaceae cyanobacterium CAN_BIN12]